MASDGLSRASLIKVRSTLRQALAWALKRRVVAHNPAAAPELPNVTRETRPRRALTGAEVRKLLDALDDHAWVAMFALMARVGLRPSEASGVCRDAIDLTGSPPTVAVVRAVQLTNGRPRLVHDLKTKGARRTLAIPPDVAALLERHTAADGLLFLATDSGPVWPSTMRTELEAACERARINRVTPNELRHSAATLLADSGLAPHQVADLLGHRSTRMVDDVYRHRPPVIRGAESTPP